LLTVALVMSPLVRMCSRFWRNLDMRSRDERIEEYYHNGARELAEWVVDLEDENDKLLSDLMSAKNEVDHVKGNNKELAKLYMKTTREKNELDPSRLASALRMYIAELDYDKHKYLQCDEEAGRDRYPEEGQFLLRGWETAGGGGGAKRRGCL